MFNNEYYKICYNICSKKHKHYAEITSCERIKTLFRKVAFTKSDTEYFGEYCYYIPLYPESQGISFTYTEDDALQYVSGMLNNEIKDKINKDNEIKKRKKELNKYIEYKGDL